jgi:hypothetical protein
MEDESCGKFGRVRYDFGRLETVVPVGVAEPSFDPPIRFAAWS